MFTTEQLNAVGVIQYIGDLGPDTKTPTYVYNGQRRGFPPGTTPECAVSKMCVEFGLDYRAVTDKYAGLEYNQKIAQACTEALESVGYTKPLCESIQANYIALMAQDRGD